MIIDKTKQLVKINDIIIPGDVSVNEKEIGKIEKYRMPKDEMVRLWGTKKLTVISVVVGALADILTVVPNLDLLCVWQSDTTNFCEKYAKPYFYAKHLEKGLNRWWLNFWCPFFQKKLPFLANIGCCPYFLDQALV